MGDGLCAFNGLVKWSGLSSWDEMGFGEGLVYLSGWLGEDGPARELSIRFESKPDAVFSTSSLGDPLSNGWVSGVATTFSFTGALVSLP